MQQAGCNARVDQEEQEQNLRDSASSCPRELVHLSPPLQPQVVHIFTLQQHPLVLVTHHQAYWQACARKDSFTSVSATTSPSSPPFYASPDTLPPWCMTHQIYQKPGVPQNPSICLSHCSPRRPAPPYLKKHPTCILQDTSTSTP
jgi:hypothetical protein